MRPHDELLATARAATGLDDYGDDSFREGLELLVRDLREKAELNALGQQTMHDMLVGLLVQRLQVEDWYRRHPEIDDEPIEAPLIGLGLPRTGSTALSFLLAEDPETRSLLAWQAMQPCPPPSTVEGVDPRIGLEQADEERRAKISPRMRAMLPSSPTGPMECLTLLALDFKSHHFQAAAYMPRYSRWLLEQADLVSSYLYERRILKLLQWGLTAKRWRLKTPSHMLFLDALDQAFPDARFVMTHRDPTEVIVSVADLYIEMGKRFCDHIDPTYIGALNVEHWTVAIQRTVAFRDRSEAAGEDRFYDIDFRAMQKEPIAQIRGLYAWLGEPVTEPFAAGMRDWWAETSANREPNVHPDSSIFGIDLDAVRSQFADYTARIPTWTSH